MAYESILAVGTAAEEAVSHLLKERKREAERRFPSFFAPEYRLGYAENASLRSGRVLELMEAAGEKYGVRCVVKAGSGGVLRALWTLGEACRSGLAADIKKIPVRQETIEICEEYALNPYEADSAGLVLAAAEKGEALRLFLAERGWESAVIGALTGEKGRKILYPEHVRYIDKPRRYTDSLAVILPGRTDDTVPVPSVSQFQ